MREPDRRTNELSRIALGAAIRAHKDLGPGFLEGVYEAAVAIELKERGVPFQRQVQVTVSYKGQRIRAGRLDLLIDDRLILELKAVEALAPIHKAQVISYLKATGITLGLLLNFNVRTLKDGIQRVVLTQP